MGHQTWMYHRNHAPKVFDSDEVPKLTEEGWRDSPEAAKEQPKKRGRPTKETINED